MSRSLTWRTLVEHPQQWALACCVIVLVLLIGNEAWLIGKSFVNRSTAASPTAASPTVSRDVVERIVAAQLFGRAAPQTSGQTPPTTDLQLILRGVFTAQDARSASAMIETSDGRVQIVKSGANVMADTVLQQVSSNHVVLARNGALESLYFPTLQENADLVAVAQNNAVSGAETGATSSADDNDSNAGASPEEIKRAAILRRLEELRARSSH